MGHRYQANGDTLASESGTVVVIYLRNRSCYLGLMSQHGPTVVDPQIDDEQNPDQFASGLCQYLSDTGLTPRAVVVAVPSPWCLCAEVSREGLPGRGMKQTLMFRLEEKLPLPAEEMVGGFVISEDRALGVAIASQRVSPVVRALQDHGVQVQCVCPASLLALQSWQELSTADHPDVFLWGRSRRVEMFVLDAHGVIRAWRGVAQRPGRCFGADQALGDRYRSCPTRSGPESTPCGPGRQSHQTGT